MADSFPVLIIGGGGGLGSGGISEDSVPISFGWGGGIVRPGGGGGSGKLSFDLPSSSVKRTPQRVDV